MAFRPPDVGEHTMTPSTPIRIAAALVAALLLALCATVSFASDDCKVLDPDISLTYVGLCEDGYAHGKGVAKGKDEYEGEFLRGQPHGTGTYTWAAGRQYVGDWSAGKRNGFGRLTWADGAMYEGEWRNDLREGSGTLHGVSGNRTIGRWLAGNRVGDAVTIDKDGNRTVVGSSGQSAGRVNCKSHPRYPTESIRALETGLVRLSFLVDTDGSVLESKVVTSSGFKQLDIAALDGLSRCEFVPFMRDGNPERRWFTVEYLWKIDGEFGSANFAYDFGRWGNGRDAKPVAMPKGTYATWPTFFKSRFRTLFHGLTETDEPPCPMWGMEDLLIRARQAQTKYRSTGDLRMMINVSADGTPTKVDVLDSPSVEIHMAALAFGMELRFSPASCAGQPCAMSFPVHLRFDAQK